MKKLFVLSIAALAFVGCSHDFGNYSYVDVNTLPDKDPSEVTEEDIQANVASIFGTIDPNQDWSLINSGSIEVIANAPLNDIVKVQILTESPFFNPEAEVISEAYVSKGETVTLPYDAAKGLDEIIAACIDSKGNYYIRPFEAGTKSISFSTTTAKARTRAGDEGINANAIVIKGADAMKSISAGRTIYANLATETDDSDMKSFANNQHLNLWEGSNWENEVLWQISANGNIGSSWNVVNGAIVRNIEGGISPEEKSELTSIFNNFLGRSSKNGVKQDNMSSIRNGAAVKFFNNQLVSDGVTPITFIPVQMASTDLPNTDVYYYYYNPDTAPTDEAELANYIKALPKFKAMHCGYTKDAANVGTTEFFKVHEYLLPYFGDTDNMLNAVKCETDGKLYRIRNGFENNNKPSYLTYLNNCTAGGDKMNNIYNDNSSEIANQLWQVFKYNGRTILYNVGAQKFLVGVGSYMQNVNKTWATVFTSSIDMARFSAFYGDSENHLWFNSGKTEALGFNGNNNRVAVNKTKADKNKIVWYFDEYTNTGKSFNTMSELIINDPASQTTAVSAVIPRNYRVGFMLRKKNSGVETDDYTNQNLLKSKNTGCVYSFGELNKVINQFPDFSSAVNRYSMKVDDPRVATFNANCKTYLTFEDGVDCNFSDLIIEVTSGGEQILDEYDVSYFSYTMCFEDSPIADYDMNDVVLNFVRQDPTHVKVSLLACGAHDELFLRGLKDKVSTLNTLKEDTEIHAMFGVPTESFVNTDRSTTKDPIVDVFEIDENMRLSDFIMEIYVWDATKEREIKLAGKNQDPHAIVIPGNFEYPLEKTCIKTAYPLFSNWAHNAEIDRLWFKNSVETCVYKK